MQYTCNSRLVPPQTASTIISPPEVRRSHLGCYPAISSALHHPLRVLEHFLRLWRPCKHCIDGGHTPNDESLQCTFFNLASTQRVEGPTYRLVMCKEDIFQQILRQLWIACQERDANTILPITITSRSVDVDEIDRSNALSSSSRLWQVDKTSCWLSSLMKGPSTARPGRRSRPVP